MNITPLNNPESFDNFIFEKINLELFQHKYLENYLDNAKKGQKILYESSIVNVIDDSWIIILHGEILLIYGENWKANQFDELKEIIDLNKFTNYVLTGNTELIRELLECFNIVKYRIEKERILYKTNSITKFFDNNLTIDIGNLNDSYELAEMLRQYYHEEYNGLNDKTIEDMHNRILSVIYTQKIFVLKDNNNNIISFCTIINPDIGILFTKEIYRTRGYGKILLSHCASILIEENGIVYLMTDKEKIASNKVSESLGFFPFFNYSMIEINYG